MSINMEITSLLIGIFGIIISFYFGMRKWYLARRISRTASGNILIDNTGINQTAQDMIYERGYTGCTRDVKALLKTRRIPFDLIASPAELDYLIAFFVANDLNKPFCSIHNNWPKSLKKIRYFSISKKDRVLIVTTVLTDARILLPTIDTILKEGGTVTAVVTLAEGSLPDDGPNPAHDVIADQFGKQNIDYHCLYK